MKKHEVEHGTTNNKEYKIIRRPDIYFDKYWEDNWAKHPIKVNRKSNLRYWKKKRIYRYQFREYRTWKYNRKTKWK